MSQRMKQVSFVFSVVILLGLVLSACATPTPEVKEVEKIVTQEVEVVVTKEVEVIKEVMVTPTPEPTPGPKSGGVLIAARAADMKGLDPHKQTG